MDAATLVLAEPGLGIDRAAALLPGANAAMRTGGITTVKRAAMFLAQLGAESASLSVTTEWASGVEYEGRADLGNTVAGDGARYKGRGFIQVTGRANYGAVSRYCHDRRLVPTATYFVDNPELLASDRWGWLAAVWYWTVARNINPLCDAGDIYAVTRAINGGLNGFTDRLARYQHCLTLANRLLPTAPPKAPTTATQEEPMIIISAPVLGIAKIVDGGKYHLDGLEWRGIVAIRRAAPAAVVMVPVTAAEWNGLHEKRAKI